MENIIGIDFGTTNSEVSVFRDRKPLIIPNRVGEKVIPSAVFIEEGGKLYVGQAAKNVTVLHPDRTVTSVKRELGSSRGYRIGGKEYGSEQIASLVMAELKVMAEDFLSRKVSKAVITVPAYFDDPRRQAVKRAAALAGLEAVRLVNEPTAAALAYGVSSREQGTILVYDLGGGTFDVSVLQAGAGVFQVLATRGDVRLGGEDFDRRIAELLLERFREETGINLKNDRLALQKIYQEAERAKIQLSKQMTCDVEIPFLAANAQGPCHLTSRITREEFEVLIAGYVEKTIRLIKGALQDAGLAPVDVDRVLLVGGSTRIPAVRRAVEQFFGKSAEAGVSPEEVVACGAAVQGGILAGQARRMVLVDITPLGLGIETEDNRMVTLVARNTVLPVQRRALFTTVTDYQKSACIKVIQGQRMKASENILLGSFCLEDIQRGKKGKPDIEVCFDINADGIVHVCARDMKTASHRTIELDGTNNLSGEEVENILTEARATELEDLYAGEQI